MPISIDSLAPVVVSATYTRLGNTTAYTAADALTNNTAGMVALTFSNCARAAGATGTIVNAVMIDQSAPATPGTFTLMLFDTIPTATGDNLALSLSTVDAAFFIGLMKFTVAEKNAVSCVYAADQTFLPLPFRTLSTANLFGLIQVDNAYTPASSGVLLWKLLIAQD